MRVGESDFDNNSIKLYEYSYENTLTYNISYKTFMGVKPLRIRFIKKMD